MSIRKREWDGGEAFVVDLMINRKRHRKQFKTRAEAKAYELDIRQKARDGKFRADAHKLTIRSQRDAFFEHLDERHRRGKRMTKSHLLSSKAVFNNYIVGGIPFKRGKTEILFEEGVGGLRFAELSVEVVEEFYDALLDTGLTIKSVKEVRNCLSVFLEWARKKKLTAENPTRDAELDEARNAKSKRRIKVPPKELIRRLDGHFDGWFRVLFRVAALTGVRLGELRALRWRHVSFMKAKVMIETRLDRWGKEDGQGAKSDAGNREIPLSDTLLTTLRHWHAVTAYNGRDDLVFPNGDGRPLWAHMPRRRLHEAFDLVVAHWDGEEVPMKPRWHDLRHFAASCWIEAGLSPKAIQEFIGHSSIMTTMNIYGHLFPSAEHNEAMQRVANDVLVAA